LVSVSVLLFCLYLYPFPPSLFVSVFVLSFCVCFYPSPLSLFVSVLPLCLCLHPSPLSLFVSVSVTVLPLCHFCVCSFYPFPFPLAAFPLSTAVEHFSGHSTTICKIYQDRDRTPPPQALGVMLYALCSMPYALCPTLYALSSTLYALRSTLYASCSTLYAVRSTLYTLLERVTQKIPHVPPMKETLTHKEHLYMSRLSELWIEAPTALTAQPIMGE
jgi:hypothetical protein